MVDLWIRGADTWAAFFARRAARKSCRLPSKLLSLSSSSLLEISIGVLEGLRRALFGDVVAALVRFAFET